MPGNAPSRYFCPLTDSNATLLSADANQNKSGRWSSEFYTNEELIHLARITGTSLELLSSPKPVVNKDIDVNACVDRFLRLRGATDIEKRIKELKLLLEKHELNKRLSNENRRLLDLDKKTGISTSPSTDER